MRPLGIALLGLMALAVSALAVAAQQLALRSGAHEGFDRLVIPFEHPVAWRLGRRGGDYAIAATPEPGAPAPSYDLSQVFRRIRSDRLASLRQDPDGTLRLRIACACHATAFRYGPGWVVVDIADGPPPPDSRFEVRLEPLTEDTTRPRARPAAPPTLPLSLPDVTMPAALVPETPGHAVPMRTGRPVARPAAGVGEGVSTGLPSADGPDVAAERVARGVAQARAELLADLDRAATQGLISIASAETGPAVSVSLRATPTAPIAPDPGQSPQLDAITAVDAVRAAALADGQSLPGSAACPPRDRLDIATWATDAPAAAQIGAARGAVLAEFDRPQPAAVLWLARLYLHFGFGAETAALLDAFALPEVEAAELRRLALVVDFPDMAHTKGLAPQPGCPGPAAMWDLLVQPAVGALGPERLREALSVFSGLPGHLRRHLGPPIATRLAEAGREDAARAVLAAIARADGDRHTGPATLPDPAADATRLAEARLGDAHVTEAELARIATGTGTEAALALIALGERRLDRGEALPATLRASLGALAFELRGSTLGAALKGVELRTIAAGGDHATAFATLAEAESGPMRHAPLPPEILPDLLRRLFANAGDATLAETYFRHHARIDAAAVDRDLRRQGARRMLAAGLLESAWNILHPPGQDSVAFSIEDRLLGAEILMAQGAAELALERIREVDGPAAAALRLRIAEVRGDLAAAQDAAREIGEPGLVSRADLRAGDWPRLRETGRDSIRQALSQAPEILTGRASGGATGDHLPPDENAEEPSLAAARSALARSRAARDALDILLADVPAPEG